ncbi:hypothetical protein [Bosea sp. LjRoot237]|uniref:hypothetical protein n=1 Tax=Bosea sp. LjRoot237 TaxID=3342292 RepID=UPI003ECF1D84
MPKMTTERWNRQLAIGSFVSGALYAAARISGVQQEWILVPLLLSLSLGAAALIGFVWWHRLRSPPSIPTPRSTQFQLTPLESEKRLRGDE